jgi:hypothetical protein
MGEWKARVSLRIRPALRVKLAEFAAREQRSLGNIGAVLLEGRSRSSKLLPSQSDC